ncbi:MAG: hypothetical protein ABRQ39_18760 [Candidatus Eremiobacterota bacterium]
MSHMSFLNTDNTLISTDLKNFIVYVANSSLKTEILEFIYYNPNSVFDSSLLALELDRKEEQIKRALSDFVKANLLYPVENIKDIYYIPVKNSTFLELLSKFVKLYNSPNGRQIICSIIIERDNNNHCYKRSDMVTLNLN